MFTQTYNMIKMEHICSTHPPIQKPSLYLFTIYSYLVFMRNRKASTYTYIYLVKETTPAFIAKVSTTINIMPADGVTLLHICDACMKNPNSQSFFSSTQLSANKRCDKQPYFLFESV